MHYALRCLERQHDNLKMMVYTAEDTREIEKIRAAGHVFSQFSSVLKFFEVLDCFMTVQYKALAP